MGWEAGEEWEEPGSLGWGAVYGLDSLQAGHLDVLKVPYLALA